MNHTMPISLVAPCAKTASVGSKVDTQYDSDRYPTQQYCNFSKEKS